MTKIFMAIALVLTVVSCDNDRKQEKPQNETPKALEEKSASNELFTKRAYDDLIESLYKELVSKNADLKKLEDQIDELNESRSDSTELFDKFNDKNEAYFSSADSHVSQIKDSILREKVKFMISAQLTKYNSAIGRHNQLVKTIQAKQMTISDLHTLLKIVRTLPVMDKYQKDNLPDTKSMEGYIKQQEKAIQLADGLSKK